MGARDNSYLSIYPREGPLRGALVQSKAPELLKARQTLGEGSSSHISHLHLICTSTLPKHNRKTDILPLHSSPH
jgi:hypothetical protein